MQIYSALVHRFEPNIRSLLQSTSKEPPTLQSENNKERKQEEEEKEEQRNEIVESSNISTATKEQTERTMGNKSLKTKGKITNSTELTDQQIEMLVSSTHFSAQQIHEWHQSFLRDCPSGKLDRKRFIEVYRQFYPQGKASNFCTLAFNAFDRDKNGFVDFSEFLMAITLTMSGDSRDRLNLAFSMYDINNDGVLDKKELTQIIKLIYEVNGKSNIKQDQTPQDTARTIIDKLDTDNDRKLSRQEFIDGCLNNPQLRKFLMP